MDLSLKMIEHINEELEPIEAELRSCARTQADCRALMGHYGIGELTSVALLSELGDIRRFSSSRKVVRFAGLDVAIYSSGDKRTAGKFSRQGSLIIFRWAAFESAMVARGSGSPDHNCCLKTRERIGANRAALSIARKIICRAHRALRELGEEAINEPVASSSA